MPPEVAGEPRLPGDKLDVGALVKAELRVRAAEARVLDAAPRALAGAVAERVVVGPDHARLDPAGDPLALLAIRGPDRGAEAELGVVGQLHRLLVGIDRDDRQHRAEDLLFHDPHLVGDPGEDGGGYELPAEALDLDRAATDALGAGGDGVVDQLADRVELLLRGHRADLGLPLPRIADPQLLRPLDHAGDERPGDVAVDIGTLDPRAGLACVGEAPPDRSGGGVGELG